MKHLKIANATHVNNRSFDGDDHLSFQSHHHNSSASLNNVATTNYHDFELRKRDTLNGLLFLLFSMVNSVIFYS
jgi:hypothetical protein